MEILGSTHLWAEPFYDLESYIFFDVQPSKDKVLSNGMLSHLGDGDIEARML